MAKHPTHFELSPSLLDASDDRAVAGPGRQLPPAFRRRRRIHGRAVRRIRSERHSIGFREHLYRRRPGGRHAALGRGAGACGEEMLVLQRRRFEVLLESIAPDRDLANEASVAESDFRPAWELWRALSELPGLGPTTVSKLMARKRPRLIPIFDSVIDRIILGGTGVLWLPMHAALRENDRALHERLLRVRARAGLDESISVLRVFDVLAWMDGSGHSEKVLESQS